MMLTSSASSSGASAAATAPANPALMQVRDLIYRTAGIFHPDNKLRLLEDRCQKRMQALGLATLREYYDCLTVRPMRQAELLSLLNEITIGETSFFSNRPQTDAISNVVLPRIVTAKSNLASPQLRIWSAGCSNGEEPYTLAMILLEESKSRLKGWNVEILATDLNERSLANAKAGTYGDYSTRNLEPYFRSKYFTVEGSKLRVRPEVQASVEFRRMNLLDDAHVVFLKNIDLILCCNVLIYFNAVSKRRVIQHSYNNLLPHGYLFLGHSESLFGVTEEFRLVHMPCATAYVKSGRRLADQSK